MKESSTLSLDLNGLHLPELPSWFPLAWGWWASLGGILLVVLMIGLAVRWRRRRLAPKKTALRLLRLKAIPQTPSSAIELVRQAALCYYPRQDIAHLTGKEWYAFLDAEMGQPLFIPNETQWQQALYQKQPVSNADELVQHCYCWVANALPPKKRRKSALGKF
ncbi:DUF4381 domain-containing protein [Vibrio misgurnus]|uniref:DUF4381 domain-containing protein n=1 Tax=Vibrio misgurnus TaxID=2993714 RepID=UPI0023F81785|nr:DUF4381 domain-containing protein [Vibrio sp. VCS]